MANQQCLADKMSHEKPRNEVPTPNLKHLVFFEAVLENRKNLEVSTAVQIVHTSFRVWQNIGLS